MTEPEKKRAEKFTTAIDEIIKNGIEKNHHSLALKLGTYSHIIVRIRNLKSNPSRNLFEALIKNYNVDANFLFGKSENIFL